MKRKFGLIATPTAILIVAMIILSQAPIKLSAADVVEDLDSLGGNQILLERAEKLNPEKKIEVVQDRVVNRRSRFEVDFNAATAVGGDPYLATSGLGLGLNYHLTPRWSFGLKGNYHMNRLRAEGKDLIDKALELEKNLSDRAKEEIKSYGLIPALDYPKYSGYVVGNWYPFYGKLNMLGMGVSQFDMYVLVGVGQVVLHSGPTTGITAGGGVGIWLSQHFSSRLEVSYETYEVNRFTGKKRLDLTDLGLSVGYLL